ncbi:MAG: class C sortase [Andreesenia angusta]|nr:class C sortase [Andreesenia angusta]
MKAKNSFKNRLDNILRSRKFLIAMLILGLLILIYPLISNLYYNIKQENHINEYDKLIEGMNEAEIKKIFESAYEFNSELYYRGGKDILSEPKFSYIEESKRDNTYPEYFDNDKLIARVEIPKIKTKIPIYVGVEEDILKRGCGFMLPSTLPVGGYDTNSVITAHRGLPENRLFRDLDQLKNEDIFFIKILGKTLAYKVNKKEIIKPTDFSKLSIEDGEDEVTLLTCHPYTINSHRLIVKGHRVEYNEEIEKEAKKQKDDNFWQLFFAKYKEYIYGILIFLIISGIVKIKEKK